MSKANDEEGRMAEPTGDDGEQDDDGRLTPEEEEMTVSIPEGIAGRDEGGVCGWVETELLVAALAADWTHSRAAELAGVEEGVLAMRLSDSRFPHLMALGRKGPGPGAGRASGLSRELIDMTRMELGMLTGQFRLQATRMVLDWTLRSLTGEELEVAVSELRPFLCRC